MPKRQKSRVIGYFDQFDFPRAHAGGKPVAQAHSSDQVAQPGKAASRQHENRNPSVAGLAAAIAYFHNQYAVAALL